MISSRRLAGLLLLATIIVARAWADPAGAVAATSVPELKSAPGELEAYIAALDTLDNVQAAYVEALNQQRAELDSLQQMVARGTEPSAVLERMSGRLDTAAAAVQARTRDLTESYPPMHQRMSTLVDTVTRAATVLPYVPDNLATLEGLDRECRHLAREIDEANDVLGRMDAAAIAAIKNAGGGKRPGESVEQWVAFTTDVARRLDVIDMAAYESTLLRRTRAFRAFAATIAKFLRAKVVTFPAAWTYESPSGVHLVFPIGYWELDGRMSPKARKQDETAYAKAGMALEKHFPNWLDRVPGRSAPRAVLVLSTADAGARSVTDHLKTLWNEAPNATVKLETVGARTMTVRELPVPDGENGLVSIQRDLIEDGKLIRLELIGVKASLDPLLSDFREIAASVQLARQH